MLTRLRVKVNWLLAIAVIFSLFALPPAPSLADYDRDKPWSDKVIFFAADGVRPDLMERYADDGIMPTYEDSRRERGI
jgi:hypothetical protein